MRPRRRIWLVLVGIALSGALAAEDWRLERDRDGIQIYSRAVAGSPIRAVKGIVKIRAELAEVVALLQNPELRPSWDEMCKESYRHDSPTTGVERIYVHHDLPWPVTDRDMLLLTEWHTDTVTGVVSMSARAVAGGVPEYKNRVRVINAENRWRIIPLSDSEQELIAEMHADPAGPIPAWLLNWLSIDAPFKTLQQVKAVLEK